MVNEKLMELAIDEITQVFKIIVSKVKNDTFKSHETALNLLPHVLERYERLKNEK